MTLFDLVQKYTWSDIEPVFLQLHPKQIHALATFARVYGELRHLGPEASDLCIRIEEKVDNEGQSFMDVYGEKRTPIDEVAQGGALTEMAPVERYGLDLVMWPEWLGLQIDERTFADYSEEAILSHCLYELTFYGYTLNEVTEHRNQVMHGV